MNKIEIVIAEDRPLMLTGLQKWLDARPKYHVRATATNAERLLAKLERETADLIVVSSAIAATGDASPHMTEFPVLRTLRQRFPDTPVVVLTAHTDLRVLRAQQDAGAAGIVGRLDDAQELERVCTRVISGATGVLSKRIAELWDAARAYRTGPDYRDVRLSVRPLVAFAPRG